MTMKKDLIEIYTTKINSAETLEELADIGIDMLKRMNLSGKPIIEICGPITTGGLGSVEKNLALLEKAINFVNTKELQSLNIALFEDAMKRIVSKHPDTYPKVNGYPVAILESFYRKIFESGYIKKFLFLPGWQSSKGATWERNLAPTLGIKVEEYPKEWLSEIESK